MTDTILEFKVNLAQMLDNDIIADAYEKLLPDDKAMIDSLADKVERRIKDLRGPQNIMFGPKQALEVLVKFGIWHLERMPHWEPHQE